MAVPVASGRWPVFGRTPTPPRRRFGFVQGLRTHGDLVLWSAKFRKGAMFDSFRPFVGNGLVNSARAFHLRQRRPIHREGIAHYTDTLRTTATALNESWRPGTRSTTRPNSPVLPAAAVAWADRMVGR